MLSIYHFLSVVTMADRVSFSPVKRVLTFSPTDSASKVGKSKKKRFVTMPEELPLGALGAISDTVPLVDNSSKGKPSLMKAIRKLKLQKKRKVSKKRKPSQSKTRKRKKVSVKKMMKKSKKAQEGLVLSEKTTLNSLISRMNFAKVPLTQLLSK